MDNTDFLDEMQNDEYVNEKEIEDKQDKLDKQQDKIDKKQNKITKAQKLEEKQEKIKQKLQEKENKINNESTEIIGKSKRSLLVKINKYRKLFKEQLSDYKINKNTTEDELKNHIINIQDLLDNNEVDCYITDGIYECIKLLTIHTKYDVSGLSTVLKLNSKFNSMCQKLLLKYNCFLNTPIEYQMIMIVTTSVYLTIQKNQCKPALNEYLNQKI